MRKCSLDFSYEALYLTEEAEVFMWLACTNALDLKRSTLSARFISFYGAGWRSVVFIYNRKSFSVVAGRMELSLQMQQKEMHVCWERLKEEGFQSVVKCDKKCYSKRNWSILKWPSGRSSVFHMSVATVNGSSSTWSVWLEQGPSANIEMDESWIEKSRTTTCPQACL